MARIKPQIVTGSGRRTGWIKRLTGLDPKQKGGYAFLGDFLRDGVEIDLPAGTLLLRVDPEGSVKNGWKSGHILHLEADGSLTELASGDWYADNLTLRDAAAQHLAAQSEADAPNPLADVSDADLLTEARRRGLIN